MSTLLLLQHKQQKGKSMKVRFYLDTERDGFLKEGVKAMEKGAQLGLLNGLKVEKDEGGYFVSVLRYCDESVVVGPTVLKVVFDVSGINNFPLEGLYRRGSSYAVVEHYDAGNARWKLRLVSRTLAAANRMYNDIRSGKLKPTTLWVTVARPEREIRFPDPSDKGSPEGTAAVEALNRAIFQGEFDAPAGTIEDVKTWSDSWPVDQDPQETIREEAHQRADAAWNELEQEPSVDAVIGPDTYEKLQQLREGLGEQGEQTDPGRPIPPLHDDARAERAHRRLWNAGVERGTKGVEDHPDPDDFDTQMGGPRI